VWCLEFRKGTRSIALNNTTNQHDAPVYDSTRPKKGSRSSTRASPPSSPSRSTITLVKSPAVAPRGNEKARVLLSRKAISNVRSPPVLAPSVLLLLLLLLPARRRDEERRWCWWRRW
jgi:hypothetical protein